MPDSVPGTVPLHAPQDKTAAVSHARATDIHGRLSLQTVVGYGIICVDSAEYPRKPPRMARVGKAAQGSHAPAQSLGSP